MNDKQDLTQDPSLPVALRHVGDEFLRERVAAVIGMGQRQAAGESEGGEE